MCPSDTARGAQHEFIAVYEAHFAFVWRTLKRLGVAGADIDDAVQEVFLVVHRGLADFEGRSSIKTWLFGIVTNVVRERRRRERRVTGGDPGESLDLSLELELLPAPPGQNPDEVASKREATAVLSNLLNRIDPEKRTPLILAELEQMTVPEIAAALGINVNTAYSRLRLAREEFAELARKYRARSQRGLR